MFFVYLFIFIVFNNVFCDFPYPGQLLFQDPATPLMEGIVDLHHDIMLLLIFISIFVLFLLIRILVLFVSLDEGFLHFTNLVKRNYQFRLSKRTKNSALEVGWTCFPAVLLSLISVPSFALIYAVDEIIDPILTLKIIGRQWNWVYEYGECASGFGYNDRLNFESYMINLDDLHVDDIRMLSVDKRIYLPLLIHIRLLITSSDVLHCWAVPSLGVKVDAVPGRLNQSSIFLKREGVFYGMCSEICGVNHGFMPICVESLILTSFENWVHSCNSWIISFCGFLKLFSSILDVDFSFDLNFVENVWFYLLLLSLGQRVTRCNFDLN